MLSHKNLILILTRNVNDDYCSLSEVTSGDHSIMTITTTLSRSDTYTRPDLVAGPVAVPHAFRLLGSDI